MKQLPIPKRLVIFLGLLFLLAACNVPSEPLPVSTGAAPAVTQAASLETPSLPQASQPEPKYLTICMGQEPNSLYPYGNPNAAARNVLSAIYDGPVDVFINGYQPVILQALPSLENGEAQIAPVKASRGDLIVNTEDQVVLLDAGIEFYPAGCNDPACAQRYSGSGEVELDQMVVTFRLKPGILWSDGQPLTAQDSLFAHRIASASETPASKYLIDRTETYEAVDDQTVQWWGRPGFLDPTFADNFWTPLPFHAWSGFSAADLARAEPESRPPLGWGAYVFESWVRGESIRLVKNPNYFRASDSLPAFDAITFRLLPDSESGISALASGSCDLLDPSLRLESQVELLLELERTNTVKVAILQTNIIERLDLGLRPASYDNGISAEDRPDLLKDVRTRQAIAYCLNRQRVVDEVLSGLTYTPATFIPNEHPAYNPQVELYPFDPNKGIALLEQTGWIDADKDPATPRISSGVPGLPDGIPLLLNYQTSDALQRRQTAEILSASLRECGIGVDVSHLSANDFFAPGPEGPLFGRKFDMAAYAIGVAGTEPSCAAYLASEIPSAGNQWLGLNIMGYANPDFDSLCRQALRSLPGQPSYAANYSRLQAIFANDLPSIPLYARLKVIAARPDLCNLDLSQNIFSDLWNIEEFDISPSCLIP